MEQLRPLDYQMKEFEVQAENLKKDVFGYYVYADATLRKLLETNYLSLTPSLLLLLQNELLERAYVRGLSARKAVGAVLGIKMTEPANPGF